MSKQFNRTQHNPNKEFLNYTIIWLLIVITYLYNLKECLEFPDSEILDIWLNTVLFYLIPLLDFTLTPVASMRDSSTCAKNKNLFFVNKLPVNVCDNRYT